MSLDDVPVSVVQGQSPALGQLSLNYERGCLHVPLSAGVHLALAWSDLLQDPGSESSI